MSNKNKKPFKRFPPGPMTKKVDPPGFWAKGCGGAPGCTQEAGGEQFGVICPPTFITSCGNYVMELETLGIGVYCKKNDGWTDKGLDNVTGRDQTPFAKSD